MMSSSALHRAGEIPGLACGKSVSTLKLQLNASRRLLRILIRSPSHSRPLAVPTASRAPRRLHSPLCPAPIAPLRQQAVFFMEGDTIVEMVVRRLKLLEETFSEDLTVGQWDVLKRVIETDYELRRIKTSWALHSDGSSGEFTTRMSLPIHDTFAQQFRNSVPNALRQLIAEANEDGKSELEEHLNELEDSSGHDTVLPQGQHESADASFTNRYQGSPVVVIEVGHSHSVSLKERAKRHIKGGVQAVIIFDIPYRRPQQRAAGIATFDEASTSSTPPADRSSLANPVLSYAVYRRVWEPDVEAGHSTFRSVCEGSMHPCVNRFSDGSINVEPGSLVLKLSYFRLHRDKPAADDERAITTDCDIPIPHAALETILQKAIKRQVAVD
ncbi:hypothetical protein K491DRAFT_763370 [Lophiostoma macrostomum CBS 122681]|uniref:Uncharacterized protein n=1 Tax=Lophiostoma macrostomum CBS 122681 TaxID=1314788 RepID=A0A6A6SK62_9PLEO|nr:hypothetical protein K491DRAFT_763370 [Lophiostoma macrostomum CBS 122681]